MRGGADVCADCERQWESTDADDCPYCARDTAIAAAASYRHFLETELMWKWFRADQLGDSKSEENAKLLKKWLDDNKDPGPAFLAKLDDIHKKLVEMTERCHAAEAANGPV